MSMIGRFMPIPIDLMSCGHPQKALNHPPGTIPEDAIRTVYCTACVRDHRDAECEVIEAARGLVRLRMMRLPSIDDRVIGAAGRLDAAVVRLNRLEGRQ